MIPSESDIHRAFLDEVPDMPMLSSFLPFRMRYEDLRLDELSMVEFRVFDEELFNVDPALFKYVLAQYMILVSRLQHLGDDPGIFLEMTFDQFVNLSVGVKDSKRAVDAWSSMTDDQRDIFSRWIKHLLSRDSEFINYDDCLRTDFGRRNIKFEGEEFLRAVTCR